MTRKQRARARFAQRARSRYWAKARWRLHFVLEYQGREPGPGEADRILRNANILKFGRSG